MSNHKAVVLKEARARLTIEDRRIPEPGGDEILVKNAALATNPLDWKMQEYGVFIDSYPTCLGSDIAGTVDAVGSSVTHFKKGDRVTGFAHGFVSKNADHAAFQEYTVLKACAAAKLPEPVSFEEGSILPMSVATAGVGIFIAMNIPRPPTTQHGGFLVWGASSSVGSAVVQIASSLGYTVYAVCSPRHFAYVKKLGAYETFDYNDSSIVKNITQSLKASSQHIFLGYDAISENGSAPQCAEIIGSLGGGKLCLTLPYPEDAKKPAGVEIVNFYAASVASDNKFGTWLFGEWLEESLANRTFVPSPAIEKVDGGISAVQKALDLHKKGLSGKKLVIPL